MNKIEWGKLIEYEYDDEHEQESPKGEVPTEDILEGVDSRSDADTQLEAYTEASSGTISVPNGLETPESIELRKSSKM